MFFHQSRKNRDRDTFKIFFSRLGYYPSVVWDILFSLICLRFHLCSWRLCECMEGRQMTGSHNNWTVERFPTPGVRSEFVGLQLKGYPLVLAWTCQCCRPLLGHVWAVCSFTLFTFSSLTLVLHFYITVFILRYLPWLRRLEKTVHSQLYLVINKLYNIIQQNTTVSK